MTIKTLRTNQALRRGGNLDWTRELALLPRAHLQHGNRAKLAAPRSGGWLYLETLRQAMGRGS